MNDDDEYLARLRASALSAYQEEYADLAADWRSIDSKAQALISAAGLFLSATIVFAGVSTHPLTVPEKILVGLALASLVFAIGFGLRAQLIRETGGMPSGKTVDELIANVIRNQHGEQKSVLLDSLHKSVTTKWKESNSSVEDKVSDKASDVLVSQCLLVVTLIVFVMLAIARLFVSN